MNRWLPAILIFSILAVFRVVGSMYPTLFPNFQPLPAILLCSIVFLKGHQRWWLPLLVWILTVPFTNLLQDYPVFSARALDILPGIAAIVGIALWNRKHATAFPTLASSIAAAAAFYFLTNCVSFAVDPLYAKTWQGFTQAQWTGPTGLSPTWIFLRNMMAGNLLFTGVFLLARKSLPAPVLQPSTAIAR